MNCINCGAPINPHRENCEYCDTYFNISKLNIFKNKKIRKKAIYPTFLFFGLFTVVAVYLVFFDNFSETELVQITPIWYFAIVLGLYGYKAEDLVNDIVNRKADNFRDAYLKWKHRLYENNILIGFLLSILFFPFPFFTKITPFSTALIGALIWGILLAVFFTGIFPAL